MTAVRYRDENLAPFVRPYDGAIGDDSILMNDHVQPHRAKLVDEHLEDQDLEETE